MPSEDILDADIRSLLARAEAGRKRGVRVGRIRRVLAYGLKIVAAGGSLLIVADQFSGAHQAIGFAILVAIFIDSVTSNHKRLLSEVRAGYAYDALSRNVGYEHNRRLDPLLKRKRAAIEAGDPGLSTIEEEIDALKRETHERLQLGIKAIDDRRAEADLAALEAISLDNERAAARQTGADGA